MTGTRGQVLVGLMSGTSLDGVTAVVVRFAGLFDRALRALRCDLGVTPTADSSYVTQLTGVTFRPAREAVVAAGQSLETHGLV